MRVYSVSSTKGRKCRKDKKKERERERDLMFRVLFSLYSYPKQNTRKGGPLFLSFFFSLSSSSSFVFSMKTSLFSILFFSGWE